MRSVSPTQTGSFCFSKRRHSVIGHSHQVELDLFLGVPLHRQDGDACHQPVSSQQGLGVYMRPLIGMSAFFWSRSKRDWRAKELWTFRSTSELAKVRPFLPGSESPECLQSFSQAHHPFRRQNFFFQVHQARYDGLRCVIGIAHHLK